MKKQRKNYHRVTIYVKNSTQDSLAPKRPCLSREHIARFYRGFVAIPVQLLLLLLSRVITPPLDSSLGLGVGSGDTVTAAGPHFSGRAYIIEAI
jgi:hypothetical protein